MPRSFTLNLNEEEIRRYLVDPITLQVPISSESLFLNTNPLYVDLGCGNGHFLVSMSQKNPSLNYMGIEISRKRLLKSVLKAYRLSSKNLLFLHGEIVFLLQKYFQDHSLNSCSLNFPDPWPKTRHHKYRLIQASFLDLLFLKLKEKGIFSAVSDHSEYFFSMLETFKKDSRFVNCIEKEYRIENPNHESSIFKEKWQKEGRILYYLKFQKKQRVLTEREKRKEQEDQKEKIDSF